MNTLDKNIMIQSYNSISFHGERRGEEDFNYYTELLKSDIEELEATGKLTEGSQYENKFISKVMDIYHRQARCASAFIVGPAKFPVRKMEKAWDSRDKAFNDFWHWREKYFKAVNRERTLSPEAEIDKAISDIDRLIAYKERMKEINKVIKKFKIPAGTQVGFEKCDKVKEGVKELLELAGQGSEEEDTRYVNSVLTPNCFGRIGFEGFTITSATTRIRERKKKIEAMKSRIDAKNNQKPINFKGGVIFIENDRVIIKHEEKPDKDTIQAIKSNGFRWSPKFKSWCRKHTANARRDADFLLNNVFGGQLTEAV